MANGSYDRQRFIREIEDYTRHVTSQMLQIGGRLDVDPLKVQCPKCNDGKILEFRKCYSCTNYNREDNKCDFSVWKEILSVKINHATLREIIELKGTRNPLKGFTTEKVKFNARLVLNPETLRVEFSTATNRKGEEFKCPACKASIRFSEHGAFCKSCDFKAWRKIAGKALSDSQLSALITKGKTGMIKGFNSSKNKPFDAALSLNESNIVEFIFKKSRLNRRHMRLK